MKIWVSDTAADFSTGEARGVSVTADGSLLPGKSLLRVEGVNEAVLFTAVRGKSGSLYVGTGDAGKILRISPDGKVETYATLEEKEVTALRIGPDGALYAGASPGGKVYRIVKGKTALYYDTKAEYVWALAFDGPGPLRGHRAAGRDPSRPGGQFGRAHPRDAGRRTCARCMRTRRAASGRGRRARA